MACFLFSGSRASTVKILVCFMYIGVCTFLTPVFSYYVYI